MMLPNKYELLVERCLRFVKLVLLEAAGRASGDRVLKYHKQPLWRRWHRQADGLIDLDLEEAKAPDLCLQKFLVSHHPVQCNLS